ncbi:MAG: PQQ-binding-like beta-propeller repeat protein [Planctomycetota bacterium]
MSRCVVPIAFTLVLVPLIQPIQGDDWPQFLGPNRNGVTSETGLVDSIDGAVEVVWKIRGGIGMSAVAVAGGDAVTTWNAGGKQWLVSMDSKTGARRWATALAPSYGNSMGDGPRATPVITDDRVIAYTGEGILVAVQRKSGKELWRAAPFASSGSPHSEYGMSSSPLIVGENVVVHVGGARPTVQAFAVSDGAPVWSSGTGTAGYSSPTLLNVADKSQLVCFTGAGVISLEATSGKELWRYPFKTPYDCNTATPIVVNGGVFISAGENHGCVLLDVRSRNGAYEVSERWSSVDTKSVMRNEWQTSVLVGDYLYGFDNVGSAGPVTHLSCVEATTGKPVWQQKRFGKANLTLADGKLWITTMKGELVLVRATPKGYEELGRAPLCGKTRQSLTVADGHGYIRDDREVLCIKLSQ